MRTPVAGTVSRGNLREDTVYYEGKDENGELVRSLPVEVNYKLLLRGQERFDIYCAVCHGPAGEGNGIVTQRGMLPPPTYHDDRMREKSDGHIFDVITNGTGNMKSYKHQVSVADRWAIVAYVRALQRSQHAGYEDLSDIEKARLK